MIRDPRLRGLSSEHHAALMLARNLDRAVEAGQPALLQAAAAQLAARFTPELEPHFQVEEALLFPALAALGQSALIEQAQADHAYLRQGAAAAAQGQTEHLGVYAQRLAAHVRHEEREIFPLAQSLLPAAALDAIAERAPKAPRAAQAPPP